MGNTLCSAPYPAHWKPDDEVSACPTCDAPFGLFDRKHHCRCCGGVFCEDCTNYRSPFLAFGYDEPTRACYTCFSFESQLLPVLLSGDEFTKPGELMGFPNQRYLILSFDQERLMWYPIGASQENSKGVRTRLIQDVTTRDSGTGPSFTIVAGELQAKFFAETVETRDLWVSALRTLMLINRKREERVRGHGVSAVSLDGRISHSFVEGDGYSMVRREKLQQRQLKLKAEKENQMRLELEKEQAWKDREKRQREREKKRKERESQAEKLRFRYGIE